MWRSWSWELAEGMTMGRNNSVLFLSDKTGLKAIHRSNGNLSSISTSGVSLILLKTKYKFVFYFNK